MTKITKRVFEEKKHYGTMTLSQFIELLPNCEIGYFIEEPVTIYRGRHSVEEFFAACELAGVHVKYSERESSIFKNIYFIEVSDLMLDIP